MIFHQVLHRVLKVVQGILKDISALPLNNYAAKERKKMAHIWHTLCASEQINENDEKNQ